jgi:hypothetical protein
MVLKYKGKCAIAKNELKYKGKCAQQLVLSHFTKNRRFLARMNTPTKIAFISKFIYGTIISVGTISIAMNQMLTTARKENEFKQFMNDV